MNNGDRILEERCGEFMFREIKDIMGIFMYLRVIGEKWRRNCVSKIWLQE